MPCCQDFAYPLLHKKSSQNRCMVGQVSICSSHRLDLEHDLQPLPFCSSIPEGYRKLFVFVMFIILSSLVLHLLAVASQPVSQCHEDERLALFELKQSFKEGPEYCYYQSPLKGDYRKLESWKVEEGQEDSNCCTWSGVRCDEQTGHVVGLDLSSACLYGSINSNSSLFRLVHLENLNLAGNNFSFSTIPPEIGSLSRLTALDLGKNVLTGEIPSSFRNLTRLLYLDLSVNQLTGQIPSFLGNFYQLTQLHLDENQLTGQIPSSLWNLTRLSGLHLGHNQLTGQIPSFLGTFTQLSVLDLSSNQLTGQIPSFLGNLIQLSELFLGFNQFTGQIPSSFGNLTQLSVLDLTHNQLNGQIPDFLMKLQHLTDLYLGSNKLTGPIPSQIGSLIHLEQLELYRNRLHGPVPSSISELSNLTKLYLDENNLDGNLRLSMFSRSKMQHLILSFNNFSLLPEPVGNEDHPLFLTLGLASCNLFEFPEFLRGQHDLTWLDLSNNNISGLIPEWFSSFEFMEFLNISSNSLTGFPEYTVFQRWKRLFSLDLRSNQLQGSLPAIPPETIQLYFVSDNRLSGTISPMICNMSIIQVLDLAKNNFGGVIPQCLTNLSGTLTVLSLQNNNFYGGIPAWNKSACSLRMIDFSNNELEGPLPRSLANCTELEFLNVGNNMIDDTFPSWLGSLDKLRVLILQSNRLHGPITRPNNDFEFPMLQIVDLSHNSFAGLLPSEYFNGWKAMRILNTSTLSYFGESWKLLLSPVQPVIDGKYEYSMTIISKGSVIVYSKILKYLTVIDLSSNNFNGEIPNSIGSLHGLYLLNLSNNHLTGHIPRALDGLTNLEALDLSCNELSGEIPQQLTELNSLAVFNISYNQLSGPIPRVKQFNTFDSSSYRGNPGLCGDPLSNKCGGPGMPAPPPPPPSMNDHEDTDSLFELDWRIILMGFASGLVIGAVLGQGITIGRDNYFVRKFGPIYWRRRA